jgi:ElaB/YqjD/DUF883 family membrane-anchored ribosome-binding protein
MKTDDPTGKDSSQSRAEGTGPEESEADESKASAAGAAKTADRAMKDTAQKYLSAAGIKVDLEDIERRIRNRPLFSLAIAAGAGFVMGGGMATKMGLVLLGLFGRKAAAETATNFGRQILRQAAGSGEPAA